MKQIEKWILDHKDNKRFIASLVIMAVVLSLLIGEFVMFEYVVVKIVRYVCLVAGLYFLAWIDGESHKIPNKVLLVLVGIRCVMLLVECCVYHYAAITFLISALGGAVTGGILFGICYLLSRGGIGAGDVKLFIVIGFFTNSRVVMVIAFLSVCVAAIYSIVQLVRKKTDMKKTIPFGPFVLVGTILTCVLGI